MRECRLKEISDPIVWQRDFAANAHLAVFNEHYGEEDRIDLAFLGLIDDTVAAYSTASMISGGGIHLNYGGAVEKFRGSKEILVLYGMMIREYKKRAKYLRTYVLNKNQNYLTLALRQGFIVTGTRNFRGDTLVELTLDQEEK